MGGLCLTGDGALGYKLGRVRVYLFVILLREWIYQKTQSSVAVAFGAHITQNLLLRSLSDRFEKLQRKQGFISNSALVHLATVICVMSC